MYVKSGLCRGALALACFGGLFAEVRAEEEVAPDPRTRIRQVNAIRGGQVHGSPSGVRLLTPQDEPDISEDETGDGVIPAQQVAPLAPSDTLRPAAPRVAPSAASAAGTLVGPPTLASMTSGRGRAQLLARGRNTAPAMIGDFFGGAPASSSLLPGTPFEQVATMNKGAFLGGLNTTGNIIVPNGQFFGVPGGTGVAGAPGSIVSANGTPQAIPGLLPVSAQGNPLPGTGIPAPLVATATGQTVGMFTTLPSRGPVFDPTSPIFGLRPVLNVALPDPGASGGGLVGRQKIGENTSPMPRDRVFFNYNFFSSVPLNANGVGVSRFTPGFEKTFFDGSTSIEMRIPFASTLGNNILADGGTSAGSTQFGDLSLVGKALLYTDDALAVSGGMQFAVPTGNDLNIGLSDGTELVQIKNDTVHLMPFLGALYTPDDRFYTQGFLQIDTPANGNRVSVNNFGGSLVSAGTIRDIPYLYADLGSGYWLYRNDDAQGLTGFSTTMELHYNRSLQPTHVLTTSLYRIGSVASNVEMLNIVLGGHLHFNQNSTLSIGYATPLGNGSDQMFNGELRAFFNYRFGPQTSRTRTTL